MKAPKYWAEFEEKLSRGKKEAQEYLLNRRVLELIKVCEKYQDFCDNNFWRTAYLFNYYDTENNYSNKNWKNIFLKRYWKDRSSSYKDNPIDFTRLSSQQKIEVIRYFNYEPFDAINISIRNLGNNRWFYGPETDLVKALIIYTNRDKLTDTSRIDIQTVSEYYNLNNLTEIGYNANQINNIAGLILGFYFNYSSDEEFEIMYQNYRKNYVDQILQKINAKKYEVPDFLPVLSPYFHQNEKYKGIIFCHGKKHKAPEIPQGTNPNTSWTLVDIDEDTDPDVVGSYNSWDTLKKLGLGIYDYVLSYYCPIAGDPERFSNFIRNVRWLLKKGGKLYIIRGKKVLHGDPYLSTGFLNIFLDKYHYLIDETETTDNLLVLIAK